MEAIGEFIILPEGSEPVEYFCPKCGHLRLWARGGNPDKCQNCGYGLLVIGKPGELDKEELKKKWSRMKD